MPDARVIVDLLNKGFKSEVVKLAVDVPGIRHISTGLQSMDLATGGGLPLGMPILLAGQKSSGKSAFCYKMAGRCVEELQRPAFLLQAEQGFDIDWAIKCGLPANGMVFTDKIPDLRSGLQYILNGVKEHQPSCVIMDSLSALSADPDKSLHESTSRGERAIPINEFFRKLGPLMDYDNPPLMIFIEHLHQDVNNPHGGFKTMGGETKGYMAVLEMRFRTASKVKRVVEYGDNEIEIPVEAEIRWEIRKNKVAPTGFEGTFTLGLVDTPITVAGEISDFGELLAIGQKMGVIKKAGSWYVIGENKVQGIGGIKAAYTTDALREIIAAARNTGGEKSNRKAGGETNAEERGDTTAKGRRKTRKNILTGKQSDGEEVVQCDTGDVEQSDERSNGSSENTDS